MKDLKIINEISVPIRKYTQLEQSINELHDNYGAESGFNYDDPVDTEDIINNFLGFDFIPLKLPEGVLGCTYFESKRVIVDADLYEKNPKRANFTAAHEIAHIKLHEKYYFRHKEQKKFDFVTADAPSFICRDNKENRPLIEKQADFGASCVLLPQKLLLYYWNNIKDNYKQYLNRPVSKIDEANFKNSIINDLTEELQVSKEALGYRIDNLDLEFFGLIPKGGGVQMKLAIG